MKIKWLRIKAVAKKEMIQIRRDPLSLAMAFLMPIVLLIIFGYAITFDVNNIPMVVYDLDKSEYSRALVSAFRESGYFEITGNCERPREMDQALDSRLAKVALEIPNDFSKNILRKQDVQIQILLDGSDSNTATIAEGYIDAISEMFSQKIRGVKITPLIDPRVRVWYNPELKSKNFIVPGLIAVIMAVIIALLTSLTIAREWERGTMEQLIATPVKVPELIIGKMIPYFMIGFLDTVLAIAMTTLVFHVPLQGNLFLLLALSCLFLFGGLGQGILISIVARSQILASQMAILSTFLPVFLLSGFMFNISNMPKPLQIVTYFVPARYFVTILKGIFLKGSPFKLLLLQVLFLTLYGLWVFTMANKKLKKRIA